MTLVALLLLGLTVWSLHRFRRYQPLADLGQTVAPSGLEGIGLQIQGATVTGREEGRIRWRVQCHYITLSQDRHQITVDSVQHGVFYGENRRPVVTIQAGHASYRTLFGDVMQGTPAVGGTLRLSAGIEARVLVGPGVILHGTDLTWDALHNAITCPGQITARFPEGVCLRSGVVDRLADRGPLAAQPSWHFYCPGRGYKRSCSTKPSPRALLTLGGSLALTGAGAAPPPAPATQYVDYVAGHSVYLHRPNTFEMSMGVTFIQDDAYLKTDAAVVNLDDQQQALNAKSQGPVHIYNPQDDLTGGVRAISTSHAIWRLSATILHWSSSRGRARQMRRQVRSTAVSRTPRR